MNMNISDLSNLLSPANTKSITIVIATNIRINAFPDFIIGMSLNASCRSIFKTVKTKKASPNASENCFMSNFISSNSSCNSKYSNQVYQNLALLHTLGVFHQKCVVQHCQIENNNFEHGIHKYLN